MFRVIQFIVLFFLYSQVYAVNEGAFAGKSNAVTQSSEDGEYIVTLYSKDNVIPMQKIHQWVLHIEDKKRKPVENARVFVFGGMPMHQHGFPTKPRVKKYLGNGDYLVEGIKFNMSGLWQMRFNIKQQNREGRVVFDIQLEP